MAEIHGRVPGASLLSARPLSRRQPDWSLLIQTPGGLATHPIHATTEADALAEVHEHYDRISPVLKPEWQAETEWSIRCVDGRSAVRLMQPKEEIVDGEDPDRMADRSD